jgi:hypothetical protein
MADLDLSLETTALAAALPGLQRPRSGRPPSGSRRPATDVSAGQDRMNAVRDLQEENAKLREKLADVQVQFACVKNIINKSCQTSLPSSMSKHARDFAHRSTH